MAAGNSISARRSIAGEGTLHAGASGSSASCCRSQISNRVPQRKSRAFSGR